MQADTSAHSPVRTAVVAGVGMVPFRKPRETQNYPQMGSEAAGLALRDAEIDYDLVQQAYVGYVYGDSTCGQRALYEVGLTGIPIVNVNNNCATGSTALWLARQAVASGAVECALAVGFEQMRNGALSATYGDRPDPLGRLADTRDKAQGRVSDEIPMSAQFFGGAGTAYAEDYGTDPTLFAQVAVKARKHAALNPNAVFRAPVTLHEVLDSPHIFGPLTRLQCCPPTCGGAAAVICSEEFAERHGLNGSVVIRAQEMTTDTASTFESGDMRKVVGYDLAADAAQAVYESSGVAPEDVRVVELHDCFSTNEVLAYEALGLCGQGEASRFVADGDNTYGGRVVTNPSGGLLSKGHPLGATGLAQCAELVWQLRGQAGARQVADADVALQHNLGLGGACVVTLYERLGT